MCAAVLAAGCDDNFTNPPIIMPPVIHQEGNISLQDFKNICWPTLTQGPVQVGFNQDGDSIKFEGRVCSSDSTGNIYKSIIIQSIDAEGRQHAIAFSVNNNKLYQLFPFGQEVIVNATGLNVGPYRNYLQFGAISGDQMTFMDESDFISHVTRNNFPLPQPSKVDTTATDIATLAATKTDDTARKQWMSCLVRIDGVHWLEAGQPFAGAQSVTRYIADANGTRLPVRNSSYASFSEDLIPYGTGSVVGILSYYLNDWQLLLIDSRSCINFDGEKPDVPEIKPEGDGTAESPYNVAKALEVAGAMGENDSQPAYVKGIISSISDISTDFGNATYAIADIAGGETLGVYRGYWFNGDKFTSADQLAVGATVVVSGNLVNFKGNTRQLTTGSRIVSYNGQTQGGETPTPQPSGALYTALDAASAELTAGWTIENIALDGAEYVWQWKEYNGSHYLNASAYVGGVAKTTEALCISPVIDLGGATGCALSFEHAARFQTTLRTLCGVLAREEGAAEWTVLSIPVWPEAGSWTFANSGNVSLAAFDGKKVQIAFRYRSDSNGADTWEIKNLALTGNK